MTWNTLNNTTQIDEIKKASHQKAQLIFKHSTRCSVSSFAKRMLNDDIDEDIVKDIDFHYLDLVAFRAVSNQIANDFNITHQSPQILLIVDGKCIHDASHSDINLEDVKKLI